LHLHFLLQAAILFPPNSPLRESGDPIAQTVIVLILSMLLSARDDTKLAFIFGQENTHHIQGTC
jgi:hypothetical protein